MDGGSRPSLRVHPDRGQGRSGGPWVSGRVSERGRGHANAGKAPWGSARTRRWLHSLAPSPSCWASPTLPSRRFLKSEMRQSGFRTHLSNPRLCSSVFRELQTRDQLRPPSIPPTALDPVRRRTGALLSSRPWELTAGHGNALALERKGPDPSSLVPVDWAWTRFRVSLICPQPHALRDPGKF